MNSGVSTALVKSFLADIVSTMKNLFTNILELLAVSVFGVVPSVLIKLLTNI